MIHEDKFKCGFVTLIGRPNVGKSTLMNHLIGQKIAITSKRPQTTRNRIQTVYTDDQAQIIFLDTPGIHRAKNRLGEYMDRVAKSTFSQVDVILWLVEPGTFIGKGEQEIARALKQVNTPVILIMNKVDTVEKAKLPEYMDAYRKIYPFADMIAVSALRAVNLDTLMDAIVKYLPYGPALYDEDTITDQPMRDIAAEVIREKALRCLDDEVPHGIAVSIEKMRERPDGSIMDIEANIICEKESHKGIVIGKGGSMLRKIGSQSRMELEKMLQMQVNLQLWVKVRKDWRDNEQMLRSFGYDVRQIGKQ